MVDDSFKNSLAFSNFLASNMLNSLIAQLVKNPPAMQKTLFQFRGWEDPLEKG